MLRDDTDSDHILRTPFPPSALSRWFLSSAELGDLFLCRSSFLSGLFRIELRDNCVNFGLVNVTVVSDRFVRFSNLFR